MKRIVRFLLRIFPRPFLIKLSLIFNKPVSVLYKGNAVLCPVCGKGFRKFLPYGYGKATGKNRLCPNCLSLERHRLLWLFLKNKTNFFTDNLNVLHIAPEQPFIKRFKSLKNLNYTTADLESPIADVKTDIRDMKVFQDNRFDVVICNHVLEHIDKEKKALAELYRVMKNGAWAILQVPVDHSRDNTFEDDSITEKKEREEIFGQYDHVRIYGNDYPQRLREAGFEVTEDEFVHTFSEQDTDRYKFDKTEIIYLCKKG